MRAWLVALAVLVAGGLAGCGGGGPEAWTLEVSGAVELVRDGETSRLEEGEHDVEEGDRLEVVDGRAVLTLPDDASLELREASTPTGAASALRVADVPELLAGEMLLIGADDRASAVAGAAKVGIADGALRVRRGSSVTIGVYGGSPLLETNGRELDGLKPLRQATVTDSGALPRALQPLTYDRRQPDPWDRRFLGDAIDLDLRIEPLQAAVAQNAERTDLRPIITDLAGPVDLDPDRSDGESVVGAAIVGATAAGDPAARWRQVFAFRDAGAPWGIVALDQEAERGEVLDNLGTAVSRLVQRFGGVAAGAAGSSVALPPLVGDSAPPPTEPSDPPDDDDGGDDDGGDDTSPPTTEPPLLPLPDLPLLPGEPDPEEEEPEGEDDLVDEVVATAEETPIIGGIIDGLLGDG